MADQGMYSREEEVWEDFNQQLQQRQSVKHALKPVPL